MTPRRSRGRRLVLVAAAGLALVLGACSQVENNGQNSLEPKSSQADKIYNLFIPILVIAIVVGIAITVATIVLAVKFRYKKGKNENPKQIHGNTKLEIGWTVLPALLLAIIAVPTVATIFDLAENPGPKALQVEAVGKQWWWEFKYPDAKVVTANEMIIPTGRDVFVKLRACDSTGCNVIHSFWVPELAGKKDVVPGQKNTLTLSADKPGTYLGQCAEYCGLSHANMRFRVIAKSPSDFQEWLSAQQQGPVNPLYEPDPSDPDKQVPAGPTQDLIVNTFQCTNCHVFDDSSKEQYGPNLTHLASRTVFASGSYPLTRQNLINWVHDAPSMIPMSSQGCRYPVGEGICVGMPSFINNTPPGQKTMTKQQAEDIADFLLEQK